MTTARLTIDLTAIAENWRALDRCSTSETAAVVKADAYGLGLAPIARCLAEAGARSFYVADAGEGASLRAELGPAPGIFVFGGHMAGDSEAIAGAHLTPLLNSAAQIERHRLYAPSVPYGIQLDSGMNRLGLPPEVWAARRVDMDPALIMSHLACADEPDHPMNRQQLSQFAKLTEGSSAPRSLAATGGILLGPEYHFDMTRPGIGLYGGLPFAKARAAVRCDIPVIQTREVPAGGTVGYGGSWRAPRRSQIATVAMGYADGVSRSLSGQLRLFDGDQACPVVGRISMDTMGVDVTDLGRTPVELSYIGPHQTIDDIAGLQNTIGYEVLTNLGQRPGRMVRKS